MTLSRKYSPPVCHLLRNACDADTLFFWSSSVGSRGTQSALTHVLYIFSVDILCAVAIPMLFCDAIFFTVWRASCFNEFGTNCNKIHGNKNFDVGSLPQITETLTLEVFHKSQKLWHWKSYTNHGHFWRWKSSTNHGNVDVGSLPTSKFP